MKDRVELWRWRFTNEFGKRVVSSWHMDAESAARYKDAEKIEGTLEIRRPSGSTSDFQRSPPTSTPGASMRRPGSSSGSDSSKE